MSWVLCQQPGQTPFFTINDQGCYNHLGSSPLSPGLDRLQHREWTVPLDAASAHLSQLRLEFVLHICFLGDASSEGQVGVGELPPHLV